MATTENEVTTTPAFLKQNDQAFTSFSDKCAPSMLDYVREKYSDEQKTALMAEGTKLETEAKTMVGLLKESHVADVNKAAGVNYEKLDDSNVSTARAEAKHGAKEINQFDFTNVIKSSLASKISKQYAAADKVQEQEISKEDATKSLQEKLPKKDSKMMLTSYAAKVDEQQKTIQKLQAEVAKLKSEKSLRPNYNQRARATGKPRRSTRNIRRRR